MQSLQTQVASTKDEITRLNRSIDEIPARRISRRIEARKEIEPAIAAMTKQIDQLNYQITAAQMSILEAKKKVGPLIYIAKAFNVDVDSVVKYLIFIFVLVFDPLAICLVIAISESLASRQRQASAPVAATMNVGAASVTSEDDLIQMRFVSEDDKSAV